MKKAFSLLATLALLIIPLSAFTQDTLQLFDETQGHEFDFINQNIHDNYTFVDDNGNELTIVGVENMTDEDIENFIRVHNIAIKNRELTREEVAPPQIVNAEPMTFEQVIEAMDAEHEVMAQATHAAPKNQRHKLDLEIEPFDIDAVHQNVYVHIHSYVQGDGYYYGPAVITDDAEYAYKKSVYTNMKCSGCSYSYYQATHEFYYPHK